ncbi:16S rRNA (cytosine(1402)-N(4))-methyltransferase RsmH [Candidatus Gottesmanbacteria bacterium]|nr:16S rRNA (cytosine(1402)-N(4))-methyltransferase RsmH [Candidatus Gottesmanbacteria bacterium]
MISNVTYHTPVLTKETIDALRIKKGKKYIDATIGAGGHGIEIVKRGGILLGIDVDPDAIIAAKETFHMLPRVFREGKNWIITQGNFGDIEKIAHMRGFATVWGILFDLGVSSFQLDTPNRGFSYRFDAPIDLRFNQKEGQPAYKIVQTYSEDELYEIFTKFGEEERARPIAHALISARLLKKIISTRDIVEIVARVVKDQRRQYGALSRIFQALRIEVNSERDNLTKGLFGAKSLLPREGRLAVISFHSGEDRIVKQFMNQSAFQIITKKPIVASQNETRHNMRARSAKLRVTEKLS